MTELVNVSSNNQIGTMSLPCSPNKPIFGIQIFRLSNQVDHPNCRDHANMGLLGLSLIVFGAMEVLSHGLVDKGEFDRVGPRHVVEQQVTEVLSHQCSGSRFW
jgi:hypothetical protein